MPDFKAAAREMYMRGWLTIPLVFDPNGFPKKPFTYGWTSLENDWETIGALPWEQAKGLGIVLGKKSHGLAVLDVDDEGLAKAMLDGAGGTAGGRSVSTVRNRAHFYVYERAQSASSVITAQWQGQTIKIELKATGTQVAAPPTPGYQLVGRAEVITVPSLDVYLRELTALTDGLTIAQTPAGTTNSGYPRPWRTAVPQEERNNSAYIEAHYLRGAGMPLDMALEIMEARFRLHYEQGEMEWREIERTVKSAYAKPLKESDVTRSGIEIDT